MTFGKAYHPRMAELPLREPPRPSRGGAGRNLVHAADHNARVTLEALRRGDALTRQDLAELTGLTTPGIANITRRLLAAGLIREESGGRAARFGVEPDGALGLGIDIDGRTVSTVAIDLSGHVRARDRRAAATTDPEDTFTALREATAAILDRLPPTLAGRLIGAGVATSGDPETAAAALLPFRAVVERDTVCAALGEWLLGAGGPGGDSFVHVLFGGTVRAGLMIRGTLFDGVNHRAGRIGLMRTGEDGSLLDDAASLSGIADIVAAHLERDGAAGSFLGQLDAAGSAAVEAWLQRSAAHFLDAMVAISGFVAPNVVFVGGRLPDDLIRRFAERLEAGRLRRMKSPVDPRWLPGIAPASLGADCVVRGAATLPFLEYLLPDPRRAPELRGAAAEATQPAAPRVASLTA